MSLSVPGLHLVPWLLVVSYRDIQPTALVLGAELVVGFSFSNRIDVVVVVL